MHMRKKPDPMKDTQKSGSVDDACARYGVGKNSMRQIAEDAGAVIRIGRRVLVNYTKVDTYLDALSE